MFGLFKKKKIQKTTIRKKILVVHFTGKVLDENETEIKLQLNYYYDRWIPKKDLIIHENVIEIPYHIATIKNLMQRCYDGSLHFSTIQIVEKFATIEI